MTRKVQPLIHFEQLEPRILLSGDSLHNIAPNPYQDTIFYNTSVVDQFVELRDANGQVEEQINQELLQPSTPNPNFCQPIITLFIDDDNTSDESGEAELSVDNCSSTQTGDVLVVLSGSSEGNIESKVGATQEGSMPVYINNADLSIEYDTSIEIRGPPTEIVFIDSSVNLDFQLANAFRSGVVVSVLDGSIDGIQQITDILSGYHNLSAIHIISHGESGRIVLGTGVLDSDSLEYYSDSLTAWSDALTADADIPLYGCSFADGTAGIDLVDRIAKITDADVAASTDPTGAAELGGDWDLELSTGVIETQGLHQSLIVNDYPHLLAIIEGDESDNTLTSNAAEDDTLAGYAGNDIYEFHDNWGSDTVVEVSGEGDDTLDFSAVATDLIFTIHEDDTISVTDGTNTLSNVAEMESLIGGSGNNTFVFENGGAIAGSIDGGAGGMNTLDFSAVTETLRAIIHADGTVSVGTLPGVWTLLGFIPEEALDFLVEANTLSHAANMDRLIGGSGDNTFAFEDNAAFAGTIEGGVGGTNTLDYSDYSGPVDIDFTASPGTATGTLGIANIHNVRGGEGGLSVTGSSSANETVSYASSAMGVISNLAGLGGIDNIEGTANDDFLTGNDAVNTLIGGQGDDTLLGEGGDDTYLFEENWGIDLIVEDGDGGTDTLDFSQVTASLTFTFHLDGTVSVTDGTNALYSVANIENVIDGQGDDTFVFEDQATFDGTIGASNLFFGLLGLDQGGGTNTLDLSDYTTNVEVDLGFSIPGIDIITLPPLPAYATTELTTGGTKDIVTGFYNVHKVIGGEGNDTLYGSGDGNVLIGGPGNDTIWGRDDVDLLVGGQGDDILNGGVEQPILDVLTLLDLGMLEETFGVSMALHIAGGGTVSTFFDELFAGDEDMVSYADVVVDPLDPNPEIGVTVSLANPGTQQNTIRAGWDTLSAIRGIIGSDYNDDLTGDTYGNTLIGGAGNDTLNGVEGLNTLVGGEGDDVLNGGIDLDIASYTDAQSAVSINLGDIGQQDTLGADLDTFYSIEGLEGSEYDDTLRGDGNDNILRGGAGNDLLEGELGNDVIEGGEGEDTASYDHVDNTAGDGVMVCLWSFLPQLTLSAGIDTLSEIEHLIGSEYDDILIGNSGDNVLEGGKGHDLLCGGPGSDTYVYKGDWNTDIIVDGLEDLVGHLTGYAISDAIDTLKATVIEAVDFLDILDTMDISGDEAPPQDPDTLDFLNVTRDLDVMIHDGSRVSVDDGAGNTLSDVGGMDAIVGGSGENTFTFETNGASFIGTVDGGGRGVLNYSAYTDAIEVDLRSTDGATSGTVQGTAGVTGIFKVIAGPGDDAITGGGVDETLLGGAGNDTIKGEGGNDIIDGGEGDDLIDGGEGIDSASYADAAYPVTVDLTITAADTPNAFVKDGATILASDVLSGIENVIGSAHNDILTGDDDNNILMGGDGNDLLTGLAGADFLMGGAGNDTLLGGDDDDLLQSGAGDDTVSGSEGSDTASYADAASSVTVDLSDTSGGINASEGVLTGDILSGIENVIGSNDIDVLIGDDGNNILIGGAGGDTLHGLGGVDYLQGEEGEDRLFGGAGEDILNGGPGNDLLNGYLEGGAPVDDVDVDTADYADAPGGVEVDLDGPADQETVNAGLDTLINIESLIGSEFDDVLTGDPRDNVLEGGDGNDILQGAGGADTLDGGTGSDTASYEDDGGPVSVNLDDIAVDASGSVDELIDIENLVGSEFADTLRGDMGDNYLYGLGGNDFIYGDMGDDILEGGDGADLLDGGEGSDYASFRNDTVAVDVDLGGTATDGFGQVDTLNAIENLEGSGHNDRLTGNGEDNVLMGRDGIDTLLGGAGDDTLEGGAGNDILTGGDGNDTAAYENAGTAVTVTLQSVGVQQDTLGAGQDTLTGIENLTGSGFDDNLTGDVYDNVLSGGDGNDTLNGAGGADTLWGEQGDDTLLGGGR